MFNNDLNSANIREICNSFEAITLPAIPKKYLGIKKNNTVEITGKQHSATVSSINVLVKTLLINPEKISLEQVNQIKSGLSFIKAKIADQKMGWVTFIFGGFISYYIRNFVVSQAEFQIRTLTILAAQKRRDIELQAETIERDMSQLDISTPVLCDVDPFHYPDHFYWMITHVGPYKPLGDHDNKFSWKAWNIPFALSDSEIQNRDKVLSEASKIYNECLRACLANGKKKKQCWVVDTQVLFELGMSNKNKIISYAKDLQKNYPHMEGLPELLILKAALEECPPNKEKCADAYFSFMGFNMMIANSLQNDPRSTFFNALGTAAFGDVSPEDAESLDLPEKGIKEIVEMRRLFPNHKLGTIRNLFRYFEQSSCRRECVRRMLANIQPDPDSIYFIHDHKLLKQRTEAR